MKNFKISIKLLITVLFTSLAIVLHLTAKGAGPESDPEHKVMVFELKNEDIQFALDSDKPRNMEYMEGFIASLKEEVGDAELNIKIEGHTCDLGTEAYNKWLGEQRAYSVMEFLVTQGLNINYVEVESKGESEPLVANNIEENREKNRRVEVTVVVGGLNEYLEMMWMISG